MKRFPRLRSRLPMLLLLCVSAGCSIAPDPALRSEREFFSAADARLDRNGSFYFIANFANLRRSFGEWLRRSQVAVAESEGSAERREKLQLAASGGELALRLLGADSLAGVGASSVRLAGDGTKGETVFRNRVFFASRKGRRGPLWESAGSARRLEWLGLLPADTWLAAAQSFDPARFFTALSEHHEAYRNLDRFSELFAGVPVKELLSGFAGEWQLAVGGDPDATDGTAAGVRAVLLMPDRGNRLFNRLKPLGKAEGEERLVFPALNQGRENDTAPIVLRRPDLLVFCSSAAAEPTGVYLAALRGTPKGGTPPEAPWRVPLGTQPRFRRFAQGLPAESDAIVFCRTPRGKKLSTLRIAGVDLPLDVRDDAMELSTAQLCDDGWLVTSNSSTDLNEEIFFDAVLLPSLATLRIVADRIAAKQNSGAQRARSAGEKTPTRNAQPPADPPAELNSCAAEIREAGEAILRSGKSDPPPEFRLFAPPASEADEKNTGIPAEYPLLLDRPGRHRGGFHVCDRSGKVGWIPLERPENLRRMIGALQARHRYSEPLFRELIRQAAAFDRALEEKK